MLRVVRANNYFRLFQSHRVATGKFNPIRTYPLIQTPKSKGLSYSNLIYILCLLGGIGLSKILAEDKKTYELKSIHADQIQAAIKTRTSVDSMVNNMDASVSDGVIKVIADHYSLILSGLTYSSFAVIVFASLHLFPTLALAVISSSFIKDVITGDAAFTSVNEFIKALQYVIDYSISGPSNALSYTSYQQYETISTLFKSVPDMPEDVKKGLCYGLTTMWYLHLITGDNLLDKLKNIDVLTHQNLIADILAIQGSQLACLSTEKTKNAPQYRLILNEKGLELASLADHHARMTKIKASIEVAMANPGRLVILVTTNMKKDLKTHIAGVMVDQQAGHYYIRYFDSNRKEAVFTDALSAQKSISRSQAYHYLSQDMHQIDYGVYDLQEKPFLFWKTTIKKPASKDVFNPRADIAASFDFHL